MKTQTSTHYRVTYKGMGGHFAPDGWSGFIDRLKAKEAGRLIKSEEVYGYKQAQEHIEELREHVYMGEKINKDKQFQIEIVSIVVTTVNQI